MEKDDATLLTYCHFALAGLLFYVFRQAFLSVGLQSGLSDKYSQWGLAGVVLAIAFGVGATWYTRSRGDWREYHLGTIAELRKVKWPTFVDTKKMTGIVVIVVGIFAVIVAAFDYVWSYVLSKILA
jgi:preprotein translocase SecE subunit